MKKSLFAFVLMPFDSTFDDIYKIGIKEAASNVGIIAERLDEQMFAEGMLDRIYNQIEAADIVIADMSTKNTNVFYELGFAHGKGKLCILLTSDANDIPFDLKHYRHIVYEKSLAFLRDELIKNLEWAITEIKNIGETQIRVELKHFGYLEKSETYAKATVFHTFDFFNDSKKSSPEISAIYFYLGNDWTLKQDNAECSRINSDVAPFKYRYFIKPPISCLHANSWVQLKIEATRIIAKKWAGDNIEDSYSLAGKTLLRFITNKGTFDYEFNINVLVESVPF